MCLSLLASALLGSWGSSPAPREPQHPSPQPAYLPPARLPERGRAWDSAAIRLCDGHSTTTPGRLHLRTRPQDPPLLSLPKPGRRAEKPARQSLVLNQVLQKPMGTCLPAYPGHLPCPASPWESSTAGRAGQLRGLCAKEKLQLFDVFSR